MLDLTAESPIPLAVATTLIPPGRNGRRTHLSTLLRWILRGLPSPTGEIVRLEAVRLGGRWMTSREAIQRFAAALTPRLDDDAAPTPRTPSARSRSTERAARKLETIGI